MSLDEVELMCVPTVFRQRVGIVQNTIKVSIRQCWHNLFP
uniref:Uncharacterized protein n=1 Tax=Anguilla anguilla TaxID=7936 RepID=A0A0E9SXP3_ANGAN